MNRKEEIFLRLLGMAETDLRIRLASILEHAEANSDAWAKDWAKKLTYEGGTPTPLDVIMLSAQYIWLVMDRHDRHG